MIDILRCNRCRNAGLIYKENKIVVCGVCSASFSVRGGKVFFIDSPDDAPHGTERNPTDRHTWSAWRKANFSYFEEVFQREMIYGIALDLGAGVAQFRELRKYFKKTYGVDFYPYEMVSVITDLETALPFQDACADIIILSNILEHIADPRGILNECYRILKPGGFVIGTVPFLMRVHQGPYDFHRFTNFMLEKLLTGAHFSNTEVKRLGTSLDVYKTMQTHFFYYLINASFPDNFFSRFIFKNSARLLWRFQRMLTWLATPLYRHALNSSDYTEGYGFKGYKII